MEHDVEAPKPGTVAPAPGVPSTASEESTPPEVPVAEPRPEAVIVEVTIPKARGERARLIAGLALIVIGGLVIFGGYWGASGTATLNKQIPYLLSGGMLGIGLVIAGAAVFVRISMSRFLRYWMIRDVYERRVQADRIIESMNGVEAVLRAATRRASGPHDGVNQ